MRDLIVFIYLLITFVIGYMIGVYNSNNDNYDGGY